MKTNINHYRTLLWLAAVILSCGPGSEAASAADASKPGVTNAAPRVKFRPPTTVATAVRVTGGSRGIGDAAMTLDVLAPNEVGVTTLEQPSLFWFQSKPADA